MGCSATVRLAPFMLLSALSTPTWAQTATIEVARWQPYGAPFTYQRDTRVPGDGALRLEPRSTPGEVWSSGAGLPINAPLRSGERITIVFWARSERPTHIAATIQGGAPAYRAMAVTGIDLTPMWRRYTIAATATEDLTAGSQSLTMQAGRAGAAVSLGPVALVEGEPTAATMRHAFAGFHARSVAQNLRVTSDPGVLLAGTLRLPAAHGTGPFPLAILIQGHGPNGRGGFTVLSERLLAEGIATLEYDKRGIGASTGTYEENLPPLTRDTAAWVTAVRRRPEIDGARIALVGHSQGGAIAPAVAAADPLIRAVVTFAGPVGDGMKLFRRSMREQLVASGHAEASVTPLVDASAQLIQARLNGAEPATIAQLRTAALDRFVANGFTPEQGQGALAAIDQEEVYGIAQVRTESEMRALRIPVLAIFGAIDPLVTAPGNAAAARNALSANTAGKVVVLDGLSHWFQEGARTGGEAEVSHLGPNLGSPRAVSLAGDWLRDVLAPGSDDVVRR